MSDGGHNSEGIGVIIISVWVIGVIISERGGDRGYY